MAIVKNVDIKLEANKATLSEKLFFYKGDKNITISMSLINLLAKVVRTTSVLSLNDYTSINLGIVKPDGSTKYLRDLIVDSTSGKFSWTVTEDLTELLGEYQFQVDLNEEYSRMTIPNCSYEVLPPIAEFDSGVIPSDAPICGEVICGEVICGGTTSKTVNNYQITTSLSSDFLKRFGGE